MSHEKKIGLFFGSFNPVHIGHTAIAGYMAEYTDLYQIWFIVSPQNPLKKKETLLSDRDRLYMVELATEGNDKLRVSDIEFRLPVPSYTIDTLTYLKEKYPDVKLCLIMGEDSLYTLHKWKNAGELVSQYPIYVYPRKDVVKSSNQLLNELLKKAEIIFASAPIIEISSTFIRQGIKEKKDMSYFLHPAVWKYIREMHFYEK